MALHPRISGPTASDLCITQRLSRYTCMSDPLTLLTASSVSAPQLLPDFAKTGPPHKLGMSNGSNKLMAPQPGLSSAC